MNNKLFKVGIYARISRDDETIKESNSISNQKKLLLAYLAHEKNIEIIDYYIDDGYTGTDFNRPAFLRMYNDIKQERINTIIVKDLSRLGRNYITLGEYLEYIFPLYNIRIISVNDNIDNYKNPNSLNNILVPFKNLLNDEYARDISIKVKSALNAKRYNGEYVGSTPPYGYKKDPFNKNKLIIDKNTSSIVQLIFTLANKNYSFLKIANYLNDLNIINPATYKEIYYNQKNINNSLNKTGSWSSSSISSILHNRVYCGDLVQYKTKTISYKIHKSIKNPKNEMIIVPNTHDPLISKEIFENVQNNIKKRTIKTTVSNNNHLFTGYLKCYDCRYNMKRVKAGYRKDHKTKDYYFYCSTYRNKSKKLCTSHRITGEYLENKVISLINNKANLILQNKEKVDSYWQKEFKKYNNLHTINNETLNDLIKTIYIHDNLDITIIYKYEN